MLLSKYRLNYYYRDVSTPREIKFRSSIEPLQLLRLHPAVAMQREPAPALAAEGAADEVAMAVTIPPLPSSPEA